MAKIFTGVYTALVTPFTEEDKTAAIFLPKGKKPNTYSLRQEDSWVLCDMPYHVSARKLMKVKREGKAIDALIDKKIYKDVIRKYKEIVADERL